MNGHVVGMVLLAALLHATWNAMLHRNADPLLSMMWMSIGIAALSALAIPLLQAPARASWPYIIASGLIHIGYSMSLTRAYRSGEFGDTYPIARGSSPVLVALGAAVVAGDHLGMLHLAGVLMVSLGILSLALHRRPVLMAPAAGALLAGALIAVYTVIDGMGVRLAGDAGGYTAWIFIFYAVMPAFFVSRRGTAALRAPLKVIGTSLIGGVVSIAAYGIVIWAMQFDAMGAVSALRETSVVFAAVIARVFMQERLTVRRLTACAVIALGAACIST